MDSVTTAAAEILALRAAIKFSGAGRGRRRESPIYQTMASRFPGAHFLEREIRTAQQSGGRRDGSVGTTRGRGGVSNRHGGSCYVSVPFNVAYLESNCQGTEPVMPARVDVTKQEQAVVDADWAGGVAPHSKCRGDALAASNRPEALSRSRCRSRFVAADASFGRDCCGQPCHRGCREQTAGAVATVRRLIAHNSPIGTLPAVFPSTGTQDPRVCVCACVPFADARGCRCCWCAAGASGAAGAALRWRSSCRHRQTRAMHGRWTSLGGGRPSRNRRVLGNAPRAERRSFWRASRDGAADVRHCSGRKRSIGDWDHGMHRCRLHQPAAAAWQVVLVAMVVMVVRTARRWGWR